MESSIPGMRWWPPARRPWLGAAALRMTIVEGTAQLAAAENTLQSQATALKAAEDRLEQQIAAGAAAAAERDAALEAVQRAAAGEQELLLRLRTAEETVHSHVVQPGMAMRREGMMTGHTPTPSQ